MRIYSITVFDMNQPLPGGKFQIIYEESAEYDGNVALLCGASSQQKQISQAQDNYYTTMTQEAQQVFGEDQTLFHNLTSTFEPILAKGPNQMGFSDAELNDLTSSAITNTGENYAHAAKALNEQIAAQGGGNVFIPSGANNQLKEELASSAASQTAQEESQIKESGYQQGYDEFKQAEAALSGAGNVFNSGIGISNAATGAGSAASQTANEIAQEDNSWLGAVGGLLGNMSYTKGGFTF